MSVAKAVARARRDYGAVAKRTHRDGSVIPLEEVLGVVRTTVGKRPKRSEYKLPATDPAVLETAMTAWRAAVEHERRISLAHCYRHEWYGKLDEFDRRAVKRENDVWFAEKLREDAKHVFLAVASGQRPDPCRDDGWRDREDFRLDAELVRVSDLIATARASATKLSSEQVFMSLMELAEHAGAKR